MVKRLNRAVKSGSFSLQVFPARKNYGYNFNDYSHNLKNYSHNLLEGMRHRDKKRNAFLLFFAQLFVTLRHKTNH